LIAPAPALGLPWRRVAACVLHTYNRMIEANAFGSDGDVHQYSSTDSQVQVTS